MVTTTTLLCSKFSPQCVRVMDSLRKLNISIEPHIRLLWIDNPNVRSYVRTTQVKSVPCIVVHDEERDISIVYEKDRFTDYLNNFIQQRQARVGASAHSQGIVPVGQPPHLTAMAGNTAFQAQHQRFTAQQQNMQHTLQLAQADLATHQVQTLGIAPNPEAIRSSISRQMFGSDQPPRPISETGLTGMKAMGQKMVDDMKQHNTEQELRSRQNLPRLKEEALKKTAMLNQQTQQKMDLGRQQRQQETLAKSQETEQLSKMNLMSQLRKLPQYNTMSDKDLSVVTDEKILSYEMNQLEQAQTQLTNLRQLHASAPEKVVEIDKELQAVAYAKLGLAQKRLQLPQLEEANDLPFIGREEKSELQKAKEHYANDKLETDLGMAKKAQQKSGITNITDLLGDSEESLYDHAKRKGTDFHQSEAQVNTAMASSKRSAMNQKVREMSQTRPVQIDRGAGHEQMAKSSMGVIPDKKTEMTPIADLEEDMIDSGDPSDDGPTVSSALKKKNSALDVAREMEKGRGLLEQEYERRA